ncbi:MAG: aspartate 1-decarboxylase [Thermoleophilia bacterium]
MQRTLLSGKIHRATVTDADLDYEGSITIDAELLAAAGMLPNELVHVWDITNGGRITTYTLSGEHGSGVVCVNGAAAHIVQRGDLVVIASFAQVDEVEAESWTPRLVFVDSHNRIAATRAERLPEAPSAR